MAADLQNAKMHYLVLIHDHQTATIVIIVVIVIVVIVIAIIVAVTATATIIGSCCCGRSLTITNSLTTSSRILAIARHDSQSKPVQILPKTTKSTENSTKAT